MGTLLDEIEEIIDTDVWFPTYGHIFNSLGTPISFTEGDRRAQLMPDVYKLTFSSVVPGISAIVTVTTDSEYNPFGGQSYMVLLDGATEYDYIVPNHKLVFNDDAGFTNGWFAWIRIGRLQGNVANYGVGAGTPQTERKHRITNTGDSAATEVTVSIVKFVEHVMKLGVIFSYVFDFAESATVKLLGTRIMPYAIEVTVVTGVGASKVIAFKVDDEFINIKNLTDNSLTTSETVNVVDKYIVTDGDLQDLIFQASENCIITSTANIFAFPNDHIEIAADDAGEPDTFGTSSVEIGNIEASEFAYYWERLVVPSGANSQSNPRFSKIKLSAEVDSAGDWLK